MKKVITVALIAIISFGFTDQNKKETKKEISCDAFAEQTGVKVIRSTQKVQSNDKNMYYVKVVISNAKGIHAFGKYQDELNANASISSLNSNYGQTSFEDNKIKHTFFGLPSDDPIEITYFMEIEENEEPTFNGELAFLENKSKLKGCVSLN